MKYKYRNREFWCKGYYVDTVGKNESRIAEYIKHQLDEDKLGEKLNIPEVETYSKKKKVSREERSWQTAFTRCTRTAKNRGLCPHVKNPAFDAGIIFFFLKFLLHDG